MANHLNFAKRPDEAFEWLERAYAQRDGGLTELLKDRFLTNLHEDTRWEPLLEKMGLLEYWQAMKEREGRQSGEEYCAS